MMHGPARRPVELLLYLLALAAALAAPATGQTAPARGVLPNGLVVLHQRNPAALTLAVCCFIKISALVETRDTAGLRNFLTQTLLDTVDEQGRRLEERMAEQGIAARLQTTPDYLEIAFLGTGDQLGLLLECVREVLGPRQPTVWQTNLRRTQILREIQNRRELPLPQAYDLALAHLYRDTPCAWPVVGAANLSGVKPQHLADLRKLRCVPHRTVLAISGPMTFEEAHEQVQRSLGDLLPGAPPPEPEYQRPAARSALVYEPWQGDNAVVMLAAGVPGPERPEFAAAAVLNAVLGSGEGSRLFRALRQDQGLAYTIAPELVPSRLCGMVAIAVTCEPKQAPEVFRVMQAEVAGLKSSPPTQAEVQRARAHLTSSYVLGHQRNAEVAHYLGLFEVLGAEAGESNLAARLGAVTTEQVAGAAAWLHDRCVWVQVGGKQP
jgi:predicted Zn-dependent peptidase